MNCGHYKNLTTHSGSGPSPQGPLESDSGGFGDSIKVHLHPGVQITALGLTPCQVMQAYESKQVKPTSIFSPPPHTHIHLQTSPPSDSILCIKTTRRSWPSRGSQRSVGAWHVELTLFARSVSNSFFVDVILLCYVGHQPYGLRTCRQISEHLPAREKGRSSCILGRLAWHIGSRARNHADQGQAVWQVLPESSHLLGKHAIDSLMESKVMIRSPTM